MAKKPRSVFAGIDPGLKGAIVLLDESRQMPGFWEMPVEKIKGKNEIDLALLNGLFTEFPDDTKVFMEEVHSMPNQGVASMFKFGKGFGILQGMLTAHGFDITLVRPQQWQKFQYGLFQFDENLSPKERSLIIGRQGYPGHVKKFTSPGRKKGTIKYHDGLVDALLIADYGRRINSSGNIPPEEPK